MLTSSKMVNLVYITNAMQDLQSKIPESEAFSIPKVLTLFEYHYLGIC